MLNPLQQKCRDRWYDLIDHPVQHSLIYDDIRFKVVPAGRRSGKTERAKRFIAKKLMANPNERYFLAAPTRDQVKKIYWEDMKLLTFSPLLPRDCVSESNLSILYPNGSTLTLIGLDKPQRIEGVFWSGGIIDEIADIKANAWKENIKPALNTFNPTRPDYRAWCWLIGVPDGLNHYYDLAEYAKHSADPDWAFYTWHSADILRPDQIAEEKRTMSARQFKQEYEASFETAGGRIYEDYGPDNHTREQISPHEALHWMHDFNYTPMSSAVGVVRNSKEIYLLDEVILESAVSRQSAEEFVERYKDHANRNITIYGDPAGKAGEKHGQVSNYVEMENVLRANNWKVTRKVKAAAPAIKDRQNAVRAKIKNAAGDISLFVHPERAKYCHKGLSTAQTKKGSTFLEEETEYQHITTAIGYCVDYNWPVIFKKEQPDLQVRGSKNHW